ncbi:hypothetical protein MMC27_001767 [Xylographa pallens]|nr:hypothetical protein [Xylographa pallens]
MLSISDPELLPEIYHRKADKPSFYASWMFGNTSAMFQTLEYEQHAVKKRVVSPCCSMKTMKDFEPIISDRILSLCDTIRTKSCLTGKPLDIAAYTRFFLSDVFNHLTYGKPIGCVEHGEDVDGLIQALQDIYWLTASVAVLPWLLLPLMKNGFVFRYLLPYTETGKAMQRVFAHYERMRAERFQSELLRNQKCFLDGLSDPNSSHPFTYDDIKAETITFTAATLDGVAAFISPFIDNILTHSEVRDRLLHEITTADNNGLLSHPTVTYEETTRLPYFMACVSETLRVDSPAQTILPRTVARGGVEILGEHIPAGTQVGASPYIIHRNASNFGDDPGAFRPDRWLSSKEENARMEKHGMWWGYGDRECAGKNYAQMEMQKLCLQLFRDFDMRPASPRKRYSHKRWAVGMFWDQWVTFQVRV